jgi:hypothetical protein
LSVSPTQAGRRPKNRALIGVAAGRGKRFDPADELVRCRLSVIVLP